MNARKVRRLLPVIIPSLIIITFFLVPVIISVQKSFCDVTGNFVGFDNYVRMFNDIYFQNALVYTLKITIVVIAVTIVSAVILALMLRRTFVGKKITLFLLQFDVAVPAIACASMMLIVLSQTGFTSRLLYHLGIISSYDQFVDIFNNGMGIGVMVAIIWMFVPYIALSFLAVLHSISNEEEDQAATLGIGRVKRFVHITLPSLKPSIAYTSILCFACVFGAFELPSLLGKEHSLMTLAYYYNTGVTRTMPEYMESYTISIFLFAVVVIVSTILMYYSLKAGRRNGR